MNVVQINTSAGGGGAERIAWQIHDGLRALGHTSAMLVGQNNIGLQQVYEFKDPVRETRLYRYADAVARRVFDPLAHVPAARRAGHLTRMLGMPRRFSDWLGGRESFHYPGTLSSLEALPFHADVIHCHNLHGNYFDLRVLRELSHRIPVVLTLHDEWMYTGHCAYTLGCDRWRTGCGDCPDLSIYPAVLRDDTRNNLRRKQEIYAASKLYVSAPSRWLLDRAMESVLASGAVEHRVIPNGVDLRVFEPQDKAAAKATFGLKPGELTISFAANRATRNRFKDFPTIDKAVRLLAQQLEGRPVTLLVVGDDAPVDFDANVRVMNAGYIADPSRMAMAYNASDIYLHAARAENFPTTVLEALACGVPVIATEVGGIAEQIIDLQSGSEACATGVLVPAGGASEMAAAARHLAGNPDLRTAMSTNARRDAVARFDSRRMVAEYAEWYTRICGAGAERQTEGAA